MYKNCVKRIIDIILSLIMFIPLMLIILVFGLFIKIEDNGPIFYCGKRLGKNKKVFRMYKLRSMKVDAPDLRNDDGTTFNSDNDPRLLKIGSFIRKTSIDELPQIINVLKGDMSFIGPRPDLDSQIIYYENSEKDQAKFLVKPGITGYAQCNGRNELDWNEKLKFDHYYVDNVCFLLDVQIFFKTIKNVLLRKGVNQSKKEKKNENNYFS